MAHTYDPHGTGRLYIMNFVVIRNMYWGDLVYSFPYCGFRTIVKKLVFGCVSLEFLRVVIIYRVEENLPFIFLYSNKQKNTYTCILWTNITANLNKTFRSLVLLHAIIIEMVIWDLYRVFIYCFVLLVNRRSINFKFFGFGIPHELVLSH